MEFFDFMLRPLFLLNLLMREALLLSDLMFFELRLLEKCLADLERLILGNLEQL